MLLILCWLLGCGRLTPKPASLRLCVPQTVSLNGKVYPMAIKIAALTPDGKPATTVLNWVFENAAGGAVPVPAGAQITATTTGTNMTVVVEESTGKLLMTPTQPVTAPLSGTVTMGAIMADTTAITSNPVDWSVDVPVDLHPVKIAIDEASATTVAA